MKKRDSIVIDVRTPDEYDWGHIPGAYNIPLFSNEEHAAVGTAYKKESREKAILIGLDAVGPRMSSIIRSALDLLGDRPEQALSLYCARGGMRSQSVAWLLKLYGLKVELLPGGYKAYKAQLKELCDRLRRPYIIHGPTGSGKTEILACLKELGAQVIDLEGVAKHRGSAFGYLPGVEQPTNEMVANTIMEQLKEMNLDEPIFFESESKKIGHVTLADPLFKRMREAKLISVEIPKSDRIRRIVDIYSPLEQEFLIDCFHKISKRLGQENTDKAIAAVKAGDLDTAVELALRYYDKGYSRSSEQLWQDPNRLLVTMDHDDPMEMAHKILDLLAEQPSSPQS